MTAHSHSTRLLDLMGVSLSGLCVIHCLALPLVISFAPILGWAAHESVHLALAGMATLVTAFAQRRWPAGYLLRIAAGLGLCLLFAGALIPVSERAEVGLTLAGASLLATAHVLAWINFRRSRPHTH